MDAGANISVFNAEVAKLLGMELNKGKRIYPLGISGHICAYIHDITIVIEGVEIKTRAAFSEEFVASLNLVGREGIFDRFIVCYDDVKSELILRSR